MGKYSRNVGVKFNEDGSAKRFLGNTVICHVPKDSPQYSYLVELQEEMKRQPWAKHYSFLPHASFHMTVFEGVVDRIRSRKRWFEDLALDVPFEEADAFITEKWQTIEKPSGFQMQATHLSVSNVITLRLQPIDEEMNRKIRGFRDLLADVLKLRVSSHDRYGFHISFAYRITKVSISEYIKLLRFKARVNKEVQDKFGLLQTNEPELTFFNDMMEFPPQRKP